MSGITFDNDIGSITLTIHSYTNVRFLCLYLFHHNKTISILIR